MEHEQRVFKDRWWFSSPYWRELIGPSAAEARRLEMKRRWNRIDWTAHRETGEPNAK